MNVAYFGYPHLGGTFQVFRQLRAGLAAADIDVQWVGLGEQARRAVADPCWAEELAHGFVVCGLTGPDDSATEAARVAGTLDMIGFDAVFVNVLADAVQTNLARYLPAHVLRILIVHNITPGTYAAARAVRDHVHTVVAISPRIRDDLAAHHGFRRDRIVLIPHAAVPVAGPAVPRPTDGPLRILFLGRIEDQAKGVLALPEILARLPSDIVLTVAGDGPDMSRLKERLHGQEDRVRLLGPVAYADTGRLFAEHHAMIMPSRFEGFGLTLVEAMAAGCVPVVSRIRGVTDWIVEDDRSGLLFPIGDVNRAAAQILRLDRDRPFLRSLAEAGRQRAARDFGPQAMADAYRSLLERLRADPPPVAAPLDLDEWEMPKGLRDSLRSQVPVPVKNFLRRMRESLAW